MCKAVNLRTDPFTVYIGRAGHGRAGTFGNPFIVGQHGARGECVEKFRTWFHSTDAAATAMRAAAAAQIKKGDTLGCFCKPAACHGDVIAAYINSL